MINKWTEDNMFGLDTFVMDFLLKFEPVDASLVRVSPSIDHTQAPSLGVQIGVARESLTSESILSVNDSRLGRPRSAASTPNHLVEIMRHDEKAKPPSQHHRVNFQQPESNSSSNDHYHHYQQQQPTHEHESQENEIHESTAANYPHVPQVHVVQPQQLIDPVAYVTEEMQLKIAYELQVWKEAREKEFEIHVNVYSFFTFS